MSDCLAAVVTGVLAPVELQRVPLPDLDDQGIIARVDAATRRGTDVHYWQGDLIPPGTTPYVPGHETAAIVEEVRGDRRDILGQPVAKGDRIIVSYPYCGHCYFCTVAHQTNLCMNSYAFGRHRTDTFPYLLGGCAEYHYYPPLSDVVKVPEEVSSPLAASAACALRTVVHGFERLGAIEPHETVVVQGCGPLGLYASALARDRGAAKVIVIGAPAERLAVATDWGADEVLNIDEVTEAGDRIEWVRERTRGIGPDIVVQCASSSANPEGLMMVRRGGRFLAIGVEGKDITLPGGLITVKSLQVNGVIGAVGRHFYKALQFLATRSGRFPFERLISGTYTLDKVTDALQAMSEFREVKPVVLPRTG
ncbi:MAG: zinc-binding dehydrogenase [Chloroflexi bacterium]|nr:zinc-binding dehydrogenase [Chloroflexota bacterium]